MVNKDEHTKIKNTGKKTERIVDLFLLLLHLLHQNASLLVFASLVLEPDADDSWTESGHLDELFLHQGVRSRVGAVAGAQRVKLFLVQYRPHPRCLLIALV